MCFCAVLVGHIVEHKKQPPNDLIIPSFRSDPHAQICFCSLPSLSLQSGSSCGHNTEYHSWVLGCNGGINMSNCLLSVPTHGTAQRRSDGLSILSSHVRPSATNVINTIMSYHHASRPGSVRGSVSAITRGTNKPDLGHGCLLCLLRVSSLVFPVNSIHIINVAGRDISLPGGWGKPGHCPPSENL